MAGQSGNVHAIGDHGESRFAGAPGIRSFESAFGTAAEGENHPSFLARGIAIAPAGRQSGLFTELEASLIGAAAEGGSPAPTYARLADSIRRAQCRRALSNRA